MRKVVWDYKIFQMAFTDWLIEYLDDRDIKHCVFAYDAKLTSVKDGKILRQAKKYKRKWTIIDLCKIANYFKTTPSHIIALIELYYKISKIERPDIFKQENMEKKIKDLDKKYLKKK